MRRIVFHAGFHKTGTTSLQQTLRANRAILKHHARLILRPGMTALCECARAYSVSREDYDLGLVKYEAALLAESLKDEPAHTIILSSEDLSGHMPGRHGLHGYGAAPDLMRALSVAFRTAQPSSSLSFFFTTRADADWLKSCHAQHLRASRMIWDASEYAKRLKTSAEHKKIVEQIRREVPDHSVVFEAVEDHAERHLGMADALLDHIGLDAAKRAALSPVTPKNRSLAPDVLQRLLVLNRSDMTDADLKQAKRSLIDGLS